MRCEDRLCVYWRMGFCILTQQSVDALGMCAECIHVRLEEALLEPRRVALRVRLRRENHAD